MLNPQLFFDDQGDFQEIEISAIKMTFLGSIDTFLTVPPIGFLFLFSGVNHK